MVTLNLDNAILDRSAGTATTFQLTGQELEGICGQADTGDDCDRLPSPAFCFPPNTDNSVSACLAALFSADTLLDSPGTFRADPAGVGRIDKSVIWTG